MWVTLLTGALALVCAGCTGGPRNQIITPKPARGPIGEIHLFGIPVALDLDGRPGTDGIGVRLYASPSDRARGMPIKEGRLEILMFEGAVEAAALGTATPLRTWTFEAGQLAQFQSETSLGTGYQLALRWEENRPKGKAVTVVARYRSPAGAVLLSTANSITVESK